MEDKNEVEDEDAEGKDIEHLVLALKVSREGNHDTQSILIVWDEDYIYNRKR